MGACINYLNPSIKKFFSQLSTKLNISEEDLIGRSHYLNASGISPEPANTEQYMEYLKYVFFIDPSNAVFFSKKSIEDSGSTVKDFSERIKAFKNLIEEYNNITKPTLDDTQKIQRESARILVPVVSYRNSTGKLQMRAAEVVIQEKSGRKENAEFQARVQESLAKRNQIMRGATQFDVVYRALNLAQQMYGTEVIESPTFEKDHIYYRKAANAMEKKRSDAKTINGEVWVPVDGSVTQLDSNQIILPRSEIQSIDAKLGVTFGNANDLVARAFFESEAGFTEQDKKEATKTLESFRKNGILASNAQMSKESIAALVDKFKKIKSDLDKIYGKGKWKAWTKPFPIISKLVTRTREGVTTKYIAGEFDMVIVTEDGMIHPYDFKSAQIQNLAMNNSTNFSKFSQQLGNYAAMLESNPILGHRIDTRASVIETEFDYERDDSTPRINEVRLVNLGEVVEPALKMDKDVTLGSVAFLGLHDSMLIDPNSGAIYSPRAKSFKTTLQKQRDALNNSRSIMSARERIEVSRYIGKRILVKLNELSKQLGEENIAKILSERRNEILNSVFSEFKVTSETPADFVEKRALVYNNPIAMLEYVENYFRQLTGMSLFFDNRDIEDKEVATMLMMENEESGAKEEKLIEDRWMRDANLQSPNLTLSKKLRQVFALMPSRRPTYDRQGNFTGFENVQDSFGHNSYINETDAFNELRKILDGCMSIDEMVEEIKSLDDSVPYKEPLLQRLDSNAKTSEFRSSFWKGFKMQSIKYSAVRLVRNDDGTYEYKTIIINTSPIQTELLNNMREVFAENQEKYDILEMNIDSYIKDIATLKKKGLGKEGKERNDNIRFLAQVISDMGFGSNIVSIENIIQALNTIQRRNSARGFNIRKLENLLVKEDGSGILQQLRDGMDDSPAFNPFVSKDNPLVKRIYSLAISLSPFLKESVELTAYENGKTYYSYSAPSYLSNLCDILSSYDEDFVLDFMDKEYGKYDYFYDKAAQRYLSRWAQEIYNGDALEKKVQLNFNKTEYDDLGEGAYALSLLAEYHSENSDDWGWFAVPTLSNKSVSEFIKFRKYGIAEILRGNPDSSDYHRGIQDVFMQEVIQIRQIFEAAEQGRRYIENYSLPLEGKKNEWARTALDHFKDGKMTVKDIKEMFLRTKHGARFGFLSFLNNTSEKAIYEYVAAYLNARGGAVSQEDKVLETVSTLFENEMEKMFSEYKKNLRELGVYSEDDIQDPYYKRTNDRKKQDIKSISVPKYLVGFLSRSPRQFIKQEYDKGNPNYMAAAKKAIDNEVDDMLRDYFYNTVYANINIIQLTSTSISFYKTMEEFQKRNPQIHSPKEMLDKDAYWIVDGAKQKFSADGMLRSVVINDLMIQGETYDIVKSIFDQMLSKLPKTSPEYASVYAQRGVALSLLGEGKVNATDGQAYNSPTSFRKKTGMFGEWEDADERNYRNVIRNQESEVVRHWKVKKDFVYGSAKDDMIRIMQQFKNSENVLILADALMRTAGIKHSKLTALYDFMENTAYKGRTVVRDGFEYTDGVRGKKSNLPDGTVVKLGEYTGTGIDTIVFKSNVKHSIRGVIDINKLDSYDDIMKVLYENCYPDNEENPEVVQTLDFDSYGIQQPSPEHFANHMSLIGSQMRILSISGLTPGTTFDKFSLATAINPDTGKLVESYISMGYEDEEKTIPKRFTYNDLVKEYQELQAQGIESSVNQLRRELLLDANAIVKTLQGIAKQITFKKSVRGNDIAKSILVSSINRMVNKKMLTTEQGNMLKISGKQLIEQDKFSYKQWESANPFVEARISQDTRDAVLSEILKESVLKDTKFGVDLLEAFELDESGRFKIPLGESMHSIKVQQLLNSIIRDRIWKQKAPGGPIIQVAGYDSNLRVVFGNSRGDIALTKDEFEKTSLAKDSTYEEYLNENEFRLLYYEALAPVPTDELEEALRKASEDDGINYFLHPNKAVEAGIITEEMLKLIGYRIPTEDKYSMFPIKVVGFVPRQSGEIIILPKDITAIAGLDFDIDKLYTVRKHFYEKTLSKSMNAKEMLDFLEEEFKKKDAYKKLSRAVKDKIKQQAMHNVTDMLEAEEIGAIDTDSVDESYNADEETVDHYWEEEIELFKELTKDPERFDFGRRKFTHLGYNNSTEKTMKKSMKNKGKRQNRIFDIQWAILTSRQSTEQMFNPQSFDNLVKLGNIISVLESGNKSSFKDLMKMDPEELQAMAESSVGNIIYPQTIMYFQHANTVANSMVGIFANQNISHAFVSLPGINITYSPMRGFTLGGVKIGGKLEEEEGPDGVRLDPLKSFSGVYINKNIASFLAAAVDAAKKNALAPIGINKNTVNVAGLLMRIGFDPDVVALFISQPIIKEVNKKFEELSIMGYTNFRRAAAEVLDEHGKYEEFKDSSMVNDYTEGRNEYTDPDTFSIENLATEIRNGDSMSPTQLRVLDLFLSLLSDSDELGKITFATKFNSSANSTGPTLAETIVLKRKLEAYNTMMNPIGAAAELARFKGTDVTEKSPLLKEFIKSSIDDGGLINAVFKQYFPHLSVAIYGEKSTGPNQGILNFIKGMSSELNAKDISKIISHLLYYALTDTDSYMKEPDEAKHKVFDTSSERIFKLLTTFPSKVEEMKKQYHSKPNMAINALVVNRGNEKAGFPIVEMRTSKLGKDNIADLKADWEELALKNPTFAKMMVEYGLLTNGFGYSPKTGLHNTPIFLKYILGDYAGHYIEEIRKVTTQPDAYLTSYSEFNPASDNKNGETENGFDAESNFIIQFFRNNYENRKFVTKINKPKEIHLFIDADDEVSPETNLDSWKEYSEKFGNPPVWFLYKNTLFFNKNYASPITDEVEPEYITLSPLGINNTLVEYNAEGIEESVVPEVRSYFRSLAKEDAEDEDSDSEEQLVDEDLKGTLNNAYALAENSDVQAFAEIRKAIKQNKSKPGAIAIDNILGKIKDLGIFPDPLVDKIQNEAEQRKKELKIC